MPRSRTPAAPALDAPALYFNRELAALEFNFRVLAQAQDPAVPLLERLRYMLVLEHRYPHFEEFIHRLQQPG